MTPDAALGILDMFDKLSKLFKKKKPPVVTTVPDRPERKKKTEKELATERGEPWVEVVGVELDEDNIGNGAFELDFNEIFVARLVKAGYRGKDDYAIVDQWFTEVCRNIVMENFEQWEANHPDQSPRIVNRRDIGGGRTEVS